jgi:protoporphyrinogen oxidase
MQWRETKMGYWYQDEIQEWGNPVALLKFRGLSLIAKLRYGLFAFISSKRKRWEHLDKLEAISWIKKWVGAEAYLVMWKSLFELKFYQFSSNLSAAWIWSRIRRIGKSRYSIFREKLGYIEGGSKTLLNALSASILELGGEINLSSPVSKVVIENNKITGIEVNSKFEQFDQVISTVPVPFISKLIPDLPTNISSMFASINNIGVVCVIAKINKPVSPNFWLNINDPEMDIPGLVEYSNLMPMEETIVYVPFYLPGDHPKFSDSDEIFISKVKKYLNKINSSINESNFIDVRASRYRFAQPICEPEFLKKIPALDLGIKGLLVADTCYYYPEDRGISESIDFGRNLAKKVAHD